MDMTSSKLEFNRGFLLTNLVMELYSRLECLVNVQSFACGIGLV